jgi:hypothetical protein
MLEPAGTQLARDSRAVIPGDKPVLGFGEGAPTERSSDAAESVHINRRQVATENVVFMESRRVFAAGIADVVSSIAS